MARKTAYEELLVKPVKVTSLVPHFHVWMENCGFWCIPGRGGSLPSVFVASKMLTVKCSCVGFFVTLLFVVSSSTSGYSCIFLLSFSLWHSIKDVSVCKHSANVSIVQATLFHSCLWGILSDCIIVCRGRKYLSLRSRRHKNRSSRCRGTLDCAVRCTRPVVELQWT